MFSINKYILSKMGWVDYNSNSNIHHIYFRIYENNMSKISKYFLDDQKKIVYAIQEINSEDKLNDYKEYNFIIIDFFKKKLNYKNKKIDSNIQLLSLIRENMACSKSYQRLFKINKLIKNEKRS
jgi:hypothetical protein